MPSDDWRKYAVHGTQIIATVLAGVLIGYWLDEYNQSEKPIFTIILGLVAVILALYQFIKSFL